MSPVLVVFNLKTVFLNHLPGKVLRADPSLIIHNKTQFKGRLKVKFQKRQRIQDRSQIMKRKQSILR